VSGAGEVEPAALAAWRRQAHAEFIRFSAELPPALRAQVPPSWRDASLEFSGKPYPPLMADFFGVHDERVILDAFMASLMMEAHCSFQDARIDGHARGPLALSEALGNLLFAESLGRFQRFAGDAAALAPYVRQAFADLAEGYAVEARPAAEQDFFTAVTNRCAPFQILMAALGLHAGQAEKIAPGWQMARHLLFWFQLLDDLEDYPEDLARGRQTHLLYRLEPLMEGRPFAGWTVRAVDDALYLFGGLEMLLAEAMVQLEAARTIVRQEAPRALLLEGMLARFLAHHGELRAWCFERKRAFLKTQTACPAPGANPDPGGA